MKFFPALFGAALFLSTSSYATNVYVGADALFSNARYQAKNSSTTSGPKNGGVQEKDKMGYGVNAGVRVDLLTLLASAELFYDNINSSSRNFNSATNQINSSDSININNRYGAKANVGFAILPRITPFLTYGLANVSYSSNVLSNNHSVTKSELAPLYGVGIVFDLPLGVSVKAAYDYQQLNMRYAETGSKIRTHLGVARLGVIYNF